MDFNDYQVHDFVCDHSFQAHCLGLDSDAGNFWEAWIAQNPAKESIIIEARRMVHILSAKQGSIHDQLTQLKTGLRISEDFAAHFPVPATSLAIDEPIKSKKHPVWKTMKIAISLAACILLFLYVKTTFLSPSAGADYDPTVYHSGSDGKKTIILADGSLITLREHSILTLDKGFNTADRMVSLTGEAYFNIAHNEDIPFIVHTEMTKIKVLGTIFNVKEYPKDGVSETTLLSGKVEIISNSDPSKKVTLLPNQKFVDSKSNADDEKILSNEHVAATKPAVNQPQKTTKATEWLRKRLDISNQSLGDIAAGLEDWYGIQIVFEDEQVKEYAYTGLFQNESIVATLEALQLSYPFKFRTENEKIIISK